MQVPKNRVLERRRRKFQDVVIQPYFAGWKFVDVLFRTVCFIHFEIYL